MRRWTARLVCLLLILSAAAGGAHAQEGSAVLSSSGVGTAFSLASSNGAEQKTASLTRVLSSGQELTEAATVYEVPLGTVISEPEGGTQALLVRLYDSDGVLCTFDGTDEASRLAMLAQAAGVPWSGGDGQEGATLKRQVAAFEREVILHTIEREGSLRRAARALGVDHSTLVKKRRQYEMEEARPDNR